MRIVTLCFLLLGTFANTYSQNVSESVKAVRSTNILNRLATGGLGTGDVVMLGPTANTSEAEIVGNPYWDPHWGASSLELYQGDKLIEGYLTRYDIKNDEFEFKLAKETKVLPGKLVKSMVWIDSASKITRAMVNAKTFKENGVPLTGFLELLSDGEFMLIKKLKVEVLKPDFKPALNVGSHDYRIVKHEHYYYNIGSDLIEIKSKKSLTPLIEKLPALENKIKEEKTKFNNELSLQQLFAFVATLAPAQQD